MASVVSDTDPPFKVKHDSNYDPVQYWLMASETAHHRMHRLMNEAITETRWRKKCIQTALLMGATQQQVAERLGISREQISKLVR